MAADINPFPIEQEQLPMPIQHITELFALDGPTFVTETYRNLLQREPDPHGLAYYLGRLSQGHSKASVIVQLALANESRDINEIKGLKNLLAEERRANHWLWKHWSSRRRLDRSIKQISYTLEKINKEITKQIKETGQTSIKQENITLDNLQIKTNEPIEIYICKKKIHPQEEKYTTEAASHIDAEAQLLKKLQIFN